MSKPLKPRSFLMPTHQENNEINSAAKTDPDALPLSARQLKEMVTIQSLRGRPKSAHKKQLVSIRYSQEVLDYFKASGAGGQARMDAALKEYVQSHPI